MYYTSMATGNIPRSVNQLIHVLIARMCGKANMTYHREPPVLQKGTRHPSTVTPPPMAHPSVVTRVNHVMNTFRNSWHVDAQNPYWTWKYFGSYAIRPLRGGGSYINGVINYVFGPWAEDHAVNQYSMTDISPRMIQ